MKCRICANTLNNESFTAKEMLFGFRDSFEYFTCSNCGCIQIKKYPDNIEKYYPPNYYSYSEPISKNNNVIFSYMRKQRIKYCISGKSFTGWVLDKLMQRPLMFDLLKECKVNFESSILDIGSGTGLFLFELKRIGFNNLTGIDPFIDEDIFYDNRIRIIKGDISDLKNYFDLITMKDSLEHMPDQHEVFKHVQRLLKPGGHVLITLPTAGYTWRYYGKNWMGLDPPRHFYIHTLKSLEILASKNNLKQICVIYNSNVDFFIISEQYARNISMFESSSYHVNKSKSFFTKEMIAIYREKAAQLNTANDGDRISIIYKLIA